MPDDRRQLHVSIVAFPDAMMSTLAGIHDVLSSIPILVEAGQLPPMAAPFSVEIVGAAAGQLPLASGMPIEVQRAVRDVGRTDIVVAPSLLLTDGIWRKGRYGELVEWISHQHRQGAVLASACSGLFLLAETGAFDGHEATVHWGFERAFRETYPDIPVFPERTLVVSGETENLVTSGAAMTWHDMVLYLAARNGGATVAQAIARFFALQWHREGLSPYIVFDSQADHGDAAITDAQRWLAEHFSVASPVEEMIRRSGLAERTFKRRFTVATGHSPIDYVQRVRVEEAKRRLERTAEPVETIGWQVGYEDPAFFRRLFKRVTSLSPGAYRRRFQIPEYARRREGDGRPAIRPASARVRQAGEA
jgi:transcriptional regulator GlxA family with amidase domain